MIYNIYSGRFPSVLRGRGLLVRFEEKWYWAGSGTRSSECSSNGAGGSVVLEAYSVSTQGGPDHSARSCKTRGQDESKTMLLWANYKTECEESRAVHRWLLASLWTRILKISPPLLLWDSVSSSFTFLSQSTTSPILVTVTLPLTALTLTRLLISWFSSSSTTRVRFWLWISSRTNLVTSNCKL